MSLNLYVSSFPLSWSNDKLRDVFSSYGHVESSKVLVDLVTKQSRGIGFVKFTQPDHAQAAINALNGHMMDGQMMHVKYATNRQHIESPPRTPRRMNTTRTLDMNQDHIKSLSQHDKDIYVACFPSSWSSSDLVRLCSPYGRCTAKLLTDSTNGKSRGCGFVKFARLDDAHACITALNGSILEGCHESRPLQVRFAARKHTISNDINQISPQMTYHSLNMNMNPPLNLNPPSHSHINYDVNMIYPMPPSPISFDMINHSLNHSLNSPFSMGITPSPFYAYPTEFMYYAMSPSSGHQIMSPTNVSLPTSPDSLTLFVCNVPVHWQDLQLAGLFASYGAVTQARIVRGPQGETRGYGFVSYASDTECMHAIASLNGMQIDGSGKNLHVAWRRPSHTSKYSSAGLSNSIGHHQAPSPHPSESDCSGYVLSDSPDTMYQPSTVVA